MPAGEDRRSKAVRPRSAKPHRWPTGTEEVLYLGATATDNRRLPVRIHQGRGGSRLTLGAGDVGQLGGGNAFKANLGPRTRRDHIQEKRIDILLAGFRYPRYFFWDSREIRGGPTSRKPSAFHNSLRPSEARRTSSSQDVEKTSGIAMYSRRAVSSSRSIAHRRRQQPDTA